MPDIILHSGDLLPVVNWTFYNADGTPMDLTGTTVTFTASNATGVIINAVACTIVEATYGQVQYIWASGDATLLPGVYQAYFQATFTTGGKVITSPSNGLLSMLVTSPSVASFSYSGDPEFSSKDKVRFYLQDTDGSDPLLSDQEINHLLTKWMPTWQSEVYIAAVGAEIIAGRFAREVATSADGVNIGVEQLQQKYNDLAASLRDMYKNESIAGGPDVGGILWQDAFDPSLAPLSFWKGMHDNYRAGQQDYGGGLVPPPNPWIEGTYGR